MNERLNLLDLVILSMKLVLTFIFGHNLIKVANYISNTNTKISPVYTSSKHTDIHTCLFSKCARFVFGHVDIQEKNNEGTEFH